MSINQFKLEENLSEKYILDKVRIFAETKFDLIESMKERLHQWIINYRLEKYGKRYNSKDERINILEDRIEDIPSCVLFSVLMLGENTLQAVATKIGLNFHEDNITAVKSGAEILAICDNLGYEIVRPIFGTGQTFMVKPKIEIDFETKMMLNLSMFLPPMVTKPNAWTTKINGGYELVRHKAILGNYYNMHEEYINLHILNTLQEVKYILDPCITCEDDYINLDDILPVFKEQAKANFELQLKENRKIYELFKDEEFSFVWQFDKRGRVYSKGYHINIQGNSYRKAMLKFAKKTKLTDRGWYWLKIDIANSYGLDKESWEDRIAFIDENIDNMLINPNIWENKADEPLLFRSALLAYKEALKTGDSNHIVRLDATCSGPQIMSVVMRDVEAMKILNVLGDDKRYDYYTHIAKLTYEKTKDSPIWGDNPSWKEIRNQTKKATMTFWYNSEAKPREFFGKDTKEIKEYYDVLNTTTKGACVLKESINNCWSNERVINKWKLPDKHTAYCPVRTTKKSRIEVKEMQGGTAVFNYISQIVKAGEEEKKSLCANVVHSIDAWVCRQLIQMLSEKGIEVSPIHDSFGVHPNYCDELRRCYRNILARLYREDIIDNILKDITGKEVILDKDSYDKDIEQAIRNNEKGYYIC